MAKLASFTMSVYGFIRLAVYVHFHGERFHKISFSFLVQYCSFAKLSFLVIGNPLGKGLGQL